MTKMYVLAKCTVTVLGVYAISLTLRYVALPLMPAAAAMGPRAGAIVVVCAYLLLCLAFYFALIKERGFVFRLAGPPKPNEPLAEAPDFVKALRIAVVFAGLMFLPGALQYLPYLAKLPVMSRDLLFAALGLERFSSQLPEDRRVLIGVLNSLLRTCLAAYLILGAPAYIKWQVRKTASQRPDFGHHDDSTGE